MLYNKIYEIKREFVFKYSNNKRYYELDIPVTDNVTFVREVIDNDYTEPYHYLLFSSFYPESKIKFSIDLQCHLTKKYNIESISNSLKKIIDINSTLKSDTDDTIILSGSYEDYKKIKYKENRLGISIKFIGFENENSEEKEAQAP